MKMRTFKLNFWLSISIVALFIIQPLHAQQSSQNQPEQPFIEQGKFLTGFSLSFINASREDFNQEFEREFTAFSIQVDGLYFISDRIGLGPLLGYRYTYRDLVDPFRGPDEPDRDTRSGQFEYGAKGGWFIPTRKLFGGSGNTQFFVDGGISWLRTTFEREGNPEPDAVNRFGYQIGTGFLFPVGRRIALETKLGFQTRRREFTVAEFDNDGNIVITGTETRWPKEVALSFGLTVTF